MGEWDAEQYAADLMARARHTYATAQAQARDLAAVSATAEQGSVRVRVAPGGVLEDVAITDASGSPSQLSADFTRAYAAALHALAPEVARHSGGLDEVIRGLADEELGAGDAAGERPPAVSVDGHPADSPADETLPIDAAFDDLLAALDGEPEDLTAFVQHPEFQRLRPTGEPDTWQRDLEATVRRLSEHADELAAAVTTVVGRHDDPMLTVEVGATGRVQRLVLKPAARSSSPEALTEAVRTAYAEARAEAERQLAEATRR